MPSLRVQVPGRGPSVYHLYKKITSMGAAPDNDIVLPDPLVGDAFAHILFDGQTYTIATLSRKSDLTVNGKKRKKHRLSHDDKLVVGAVEVRFSLIDAQGPAEDEAADTVAEIDAYHKLFDFSAKLMEKHDLDQLLEALMDSVVEITGADKGFLILMDGEQMHVKVARNLMRENIADAVSQLSDSIVAKVVKTLKPVIISDAMNDEEFSGSKSIMKLRLTSVICVPLLDRGKLIGLIYVGNDSIVDLFQPGTMQILTVFAAQASLIVANALLLDHLRVDNRQLTQRLEQIRFGEIVGTSAPMQEVFKKVEKVAGTDISVLITGETGTGKELIAREIHARSPRARAPFVTINCGAIPENLLESELFGHVKGAFTGAVANKQGKFQAAHGGT
ncbi:MAG TPA: sigma 54-interacting transcriptional regulator, partial [Haliangium sp.]|nr:sigma 54-interacting transcriptional regulator [Haliangium sp.]